MTQYQLDATRWVRRLAEVNECVLANEKVLGQLALANASKVIPTAPLNRPLLCNHVVNIPGKSYRLKGNREAGLMALVPWHTTYPSAAFS